MTSHFKKNYWGSIPSIIYFQEEEKIKMEFQSPCYLYTIIAVLIFFTYKHEHNNM